MSLMSKIRALCDHNGISVTKLEDILGYTHGAIIRNTADSMKSEKVRTIANYFDVTPTYLLTDMKYCVCPTCGAAYIPTEKADLETHNMIHSNYLALREKNGYLLNPSQAATKRVVAESFIEDSEIPDEGKVFHYETMVQCDYAEYAFSQNFVVEIAYADYVKQAIKAKKYFDLIPQSVINNLSVKYNVNPTEDSETPLIDLFQKDKEFMSNITDLWDLPKPLRYDVYKAIRHAKRDYADKEYYTNPYANISENCHDNYDPDSEKCQNCRKGELSV